MKPMRILSADLLIFARHLLNLPASSRVEAARAILKEAHTNREPGGNLNRACITQICWRMVDRPGLKEVNLADLDCIDAYEAALIALREYARVMEDAA